VAAIIGHMYLPCYNFFEFFTFDFHNRYAATEIFAEFLNLSALPTDYKKLNKPVTYAFLE
jgi:hypothetical protein